MEAQLNRCSAGVSHFEVFFLPLVSSLQVNYVNLSAYMISIPQFGFGIPFLALVKSLSFMVPERRFSKENAQSVPDSL